MMGEDTRDWSTDRAAAWEGLLELAARLRRGAEVELEAHGDLSVSMLGLMGRLITAHRLTLRQTDLAEAMGLSVSRVSRIIDILERRGLVTRAACPTDGRAINVTLSPGGLESTRAAQRAVFAFVEARYFAALSVDEVATLAAAFSRLIRSRG
jgi:DNA-binding MarR family transcriptional regulator